MHRGVRVALLAVGAAAGLVPVGLVADPASAGARRHRLHLPPVELPHALTVDEKEWAVRPSKTLVGTGTVRFTAYNRGEDNHNFVIVDAAGRVFGQTSLIPGTSATVTARLHSGTYQLFCSLFAGTPESHYARGMHTTIVVR